MNQYLFIILRARIQCKRLHGKIVTKKNLMLQKNENESIFALYSEKFMNSPF
jgi:hypothetical protein